MHVTRIMGIAAVQCLFYYLLGKEIEDKYMRIANFKINRILAMLILIGLIIGLPGLTLTKAHAKSDIPAYTGTASVVLNGNVPTFAASEITTASYEQYGALDSLGRCTTAVACIGQDIMPTEPRGSIGTVKPTGWNQNKYPGLVDSDPPYLYNRCHLIGYQLTGENANEKNLVTGTRYMNVDGMLPYENMVANYIESTGNHVMYRVTPVFEGNNLLCTGVQIEAYSVEDSGQGICFNVFCYNVQPGVNINYADGSNSAIDGYVLTPSNATEEDVTRSTSGQSSQQYNYVVNTNTKKFHYPTCSSVSDMKEKNKMYYEGTRDELVELGYDPCKRCNP